jgi:outer membrane protein assembly factor BamD
VETTARRADSLFATGTAHFRAARWNKASQALDRGMLIMNYDDPRRPLGHFMMGEILFAQDNQLQAVREFRRVADEGGADSLSAEALLRAGDAYAALWERPELDPTYGETALSTYREVQQRYEGTSAARRAGMRITGLQERFAEKEFRTAMFYYRLKAYDSAILSLRNVVATWPRTKVVPDALVKLVETYTSSSRGRLRETWHVGRPSDTAADRRPVLRSGRRQRCVSRSWAAVRSGEHDTDRRANAA